MKRNKIKPYPYQAECLDAIDATIAAGEKRALVVMASGLGKTYTSAFAVEKFFADRPFVRVLVLCHSEKILTQTKDKFKDYFGEEFSYGMYINDDKATRPTNFLFATFQTMKKDRKNFQKDEFAYVIVDEAHHSQACTYFPTIRYFQPEFLLGLTATPDRLDGQKIEEIYGETVYELGFVEATKRRLITECDYRLVLDNLSQEQIDEYLQSDKKVSINQLNRTLFMPQRDEEIVRLIGEYSADVEDPKTMIFCKTITHARKIAKLMQGEDVALIHNEQSDSMNARTLRAFRDGKVRIIISVQMLNEGIDVPDANIIVFLRNTVSPAVFYQQLGRGTRLAPGKKNVRVLDFVGNCDRIKMVLELKQEIDDSRIKTPVKDTFGRGDSDTDSRDKFTLNIATPEFKEKIVDVVELLARTAVFHWSKPSAIIALCSAAKDGQMPTVAEINRNPDLPSVHTIKTLFGSYLKAAIEANLELTRIKDISNDDILELYYLGSLKHGHWMTADEMKMEKYLPHPSTCRKRFGGSLITMNRQAIEKYGDIGNGELGFVVRAELDMNDVYHDVRDLCIKLGKKPSSRDIDKCDNLPSYAALNAKMGGGGIEKIYQVCELDSLLQQHKIIEYGKIPAETWSEGQLCHENILSLQRLVTKLGRKLKKTDLTGKNGVISISTFAKHGWCVSKINQAINADAILAELSN